MHWMMVAGLAVTMTSTVLTQAQPGQRSLQEAQAPRKITLTGCVGATGAPDVFVLGVRGAFPDPDRGIATGETVPQGSGAGPAPRQRPETIPPRDVRSNPDQPDGRYETPTMRNRSYRLVDVDAATTQQLKGLVGAEVEVTGEMAVEGFPSGDMPQNQGTASRPAEPPMTPLRVASVRKVADVCLPDHLSTPR